MKAELYQTATAKAIAEVLPIEIRPEEWGDEFYFEIPVELPLDETATARVKIGRISDTGRREMRLPSFLGLHRSAEGKTLCLPAM